MDKFWLWVLLIVNTLFLLLSSVVYVRARAYRSKYLTNGYDLTQPGMVGVTKHAIAYEIQRQSWMRPNSASVVKVSDMVYNQLIKPGMSAGIYPIAIATASDPETANETRRIATLVSLFFNVKIPISAVLVDKQLLDYVWKLADELTPVEVIISLDQIDAASEVIAQFEKSNLGPVLLKKYAQHVRRIGYQIYGYSQAKGFPTAEAGELAFFGTSTGNHGDLGSEDGFRRVATVYAAIAGLYIPKQWVCLDHVTLAVFKHMVVDPQYVQEPVKASPGCHLKVVK